MNEDEHNEEGQQGPADAFDNAYEQTGADDVIVDGVDDGGTDEGAAPIAPTAEELGDPNSDYWREEAKAQGWNDDPSFVPRAGKYQKTAREFVENGNLMSEVHQLKQRQDKSDATSKTALETQLGMQRAAYEGRISELQKERGDAIDEADREGADRIQGDIDKVRNDIAEMDNVPVETVQPGYEKPSESSVVKAYEDANPWIKELNSPGSANYQKAQYANQVFTQARNNGMTNQQAINATEQLTNQNFPFQAKPNRRERGGGGEGGARPRGGKRAQADIPFDRLSGQEQSQINLAMDNGMYPSRDAAVAQVNKYRREG
jgi:hypothetical protein